MAFVYRNDVRFRVHEMEMKPTPGSVSGRRSKIQGYSEKSKRRYREYLRNTAHLWSHEIQLSYAQDYPNSGPTVKKHRKLFIESLQREYKGINWTWRLGFQQERGKKGLGYAPHFHFMTDRFVNKDWIADTWARIVGSADINHRKVSTHVDKIRNTDGIINYMVNYMAKDAETNVPEGFEDVGRFWGMKRGIVECEEYRKILPARLQARATRLFKRWYKAETRSWAEERVRKGGRYFKWRGGVNKGFMAIGGRRVFDALMKLLV